MAKAAALMTDTTMTSRVLGSAWPQHMNKTVAETMHANIVKVGMPQWSEADQTLAKAVQKELGVEEQGLPTEVRKLNGREVVPDEEKRGGGSDDIGDISWNVPTVTLRYPANIEAGPGHNWANAIAMATPIAHKGVTAGAKVQVHDRARSSDEARAGRAGMGLFPQRADEGPEVHAANPTGRQAGDLAEPGDHGEVSRADEEVLLRSEQSIRLIWISWGSSIRRSEKVNRPLHRVVTSSGAPVVMMRVCSKCAARQPFFVRIVQPSASSEMPVRRSAMSGSMVSTVPSFRRRRSNGS